MINCLEIIEELLITQREFYELSIKEEIKYTEIILKIRNLRKEIEKNDRGKEILENRNRVYTDDDIITIKSDKIKCSGK